MQPLRGLRVLDLTRLIPGPVASLVLADLGATVDKVEDPHGGDYLRHLPPAVAGTNAAFQLLNRGKRSLVLDLKKQDGKAVLRRLLPRYDVLFEQFRPGVLGRLGFPLDELRTTFPRLIVCSLTGYGQTGPLAQRAGHDLNYLARAGLLGAQGPADAPPAVPGFQLADVSGGLWCVIGILGAVMDRDRTGQGQLIDIAMSEGVVPFAPMTIGAALAGVETPRGQESLTGGIAPYGTYLTRDGHPMTLAALEPKFWTGFCAAFGRTPDMGDLMPGSHQRELSEWVRSVFAAKDRTEWVQWASENDLMVEPVLRPDELRDDPHLRARGVVFDIHTPQGKIPQVRTPVTPRDAVPSAPAPAGLHSREILSEAGFDEAEVDTLLQTGTVKQHEG